MTRNHALILSVALGAAVTAPAWAQAQKDWQAPDIDKLADDPFGKSVRHGKALMEQTYLSTGIAVGAQLEGAGTLKLKLLDRAADPVAGEKVYASTCVACHGDKGQGLRRGKAGDGDGYQFPPLWGPDSYNNGAGMARITLAAGFIKGNMPSGVTHTSAVLSDEQAFDVAAYVNSQPRPVKARLEADFPARRRARTSCRLEREQLTTPPTRTRCRRGLRRMRMATRHLDS